MFRKGIYIFALLFCCGNFAQAQIPQCPNNFPAECSCEDYYPEGPSISCITTPLETWDVKATFDAISEAFGANDTVVRDVAISAALLAQNEEIPADSISTLKTMNLDIDANFKITRIDPQAFSATHNFVKRLNVFRMNFPDAQETFDFINNFKRMEFLSFVLGTTVSDVPSRALGGDFLDLAGVTLDDAGIASVGERAFAGPRILSSISLAGNNLTEDAIADTAFDLTNQDDDVLYLTLERNPGLTHLPQAKFASFVFGGNVIFAGNSVFDEPNPAYFLNCDARMDWFCATGSTDLYGYRCRETEYWDIYEYCYRFGYSLQKPNPEKHKREEVAHRMRRDEKLRRRSASTETNHGKFGKSRSVFRKQ